MNDPFRRLFLDQVERVLKKEPSRQSLLELLQLANPGLDGLGAITEHNALFKSYIKALILRIHPDKHPIVDQSRVTRLIQDAHKYYDQCLAASPDPDPKRRRKQYASSPNKVSFPDEFNTLSKWQHMDISVPHAERGFMAGQMSTAVAYQCINARGAIAHGRKTGLRYGNKHMTKIFMKTVDDIFLHHGGTKELNGPAEIKSELLMNGPVVSTSFCPSDAFWNTGSFDPFDQSDYGHQNDMLIVGWKQLASGEVWIVQPLYHDGGVCCQAAHVATGQFGIEERCVAPSNNFENQSWQPGPYFDCDMDTLVKKWQTWPITSVTTSVDSMNALDSLFKEIGTAQLSTLSSSSQQSSFSSRLITLRDKQKKAHSRKAFLRSITWDKTKSKFMIAFDFFE
mmetsp:Transcript_15268/g.34205  ORF Transcript_15268/g.34205 Transcript_15268/m.34205 type:complete len:396 (-) Transcript_15268:1318-2505(-)